MRINSMFKEKVPPSLFKVLGAEEKTLLNKHFDNIIIAFLIKIVLVVSTFTVLFLSIIDDSKSMFLVSISLLFLSIFCSSIEDKLEKEVNEIIISLVLYKGVAKEVKKDIYEGRF